MNQFTMDQITELKAKEEVINQKTHFEILISWLKTTDWNQVRRENVEVKCKSYR